MLNDEEELISHKDLDTIPNKNLISCYTCQHEECDDLVVPTCQGLGCFSVHVVEGHREEVQGLEYLKKGCLERMTYLMCGPKMQNKFKGKNHNSGQYHAHCCNQSLCNTHSLSFFTTPSQLEAPSVTLKPMAVSFGFVSFLVLIILSVMIFRKTRKPKRPIVPHLGDDIVLDLMQPMAHAPTVDRDFDEGTDFTNEYRDSMAATSSGTDLKATAVGDSTLREIIDPCMSSGSGSGMPCLQPITQAKQIELKYMIGEGRFGKVYKGVYHGDEVAVKVFPTNEEKSFIQETDLYTNVLITHPNILGFKGSDITSVNSITQLWLITEFCPLGSLFEFVNRTSLTMDQGLSIISSACCGLMHLHLEIYGTKGKPMIAHRDIKSNNILMKNNTTACIADFGLAVMQTQIGQGDADNIRVGTKRYMAPEVLSCSLTSDLFGSFKMADIYSFSLVIWETMRRCPVGTNPPEGYMIPYQDIVPSDPSFEEMRKVVAIDGKRPDFPLHWIDNEVISNVKRLIEGCWAQQPSARLPIRRIQKDIDKIIANLKGSYETAL